MRLKPAGRWLPSVLALLVAALALAAMLIGPAAIGPDEALAALLGRGAPGHALILFQIRLPRTLIAGAIGATLAIAGAALQGFLRNPLAEPGVLGIANAAALGAVLALYFGLAAAFPLALPLAAVAGALVGVALLVAIAGRDADTLTLILAGIALGSFAGAGVALALNLAPSLFAALEISFWLLGSVEDRSFDHAALALPLMAASWLVLWLDRRALAALALGEEVAATLGFDLRRVRRRLVIGVAAGVGGAVAVSGAIGFVGLVVPHMIRPLVAHDPARLLVPSALAGAALLLAADIVVRLVPAPEPLKLGVLTALIGAPFFLWLILEQRRTR